MFSCALASESVQFHLFYDGLLTDQIQCSKYWNWFKDNILKLFIERQTFLSCNKYVCILHIIIKYDMMRSITFQPNPYGVLCNSKVSERLIRHKVSKCHCSALICFKYTFKNLYRYNNHHRYHHSYFRCFDLKESWRAFNITNLSLFVKFQTFSHLTYSQKYIRNSKDRKFNRIQRIYLLALVCIGIDVGTNIISKLSEIQNISWNMCEWHVRI